MGFARTHSLAELCGCARCLSAAHMEQYRFSDQCDNFIVGYRLTEWLCAIEMAYPRRTIFIPVDSLRHVYPLSRYPDSIIRVHARYRFVRWHTGTHYYS